MALAVVAGIVLSIAAQTPAQADRIRDKEWWLDPVGFTQAQAISRGEGVTVGLIDGPVDASHPALAGRVLSGKGWHASDPANGWGNGKGATHGTGMASLIAGQEGGENGFLGVAPGAKILPFASGELKSSGVRDGIRWLTDHGAKVINMSVGVGTGYKASPQEEEAVRYALSHDVVLVASVGNVAQDGEPVAFPANIPGVIAVSGADNSGNAWNGSSRGPEVVIAAPSTNIVRAVPKEYDASGYAVGEGTSPAAAIVSGLVALIRSKYPQLNAANVTERLIKTAKDNGDPGRDNLFGFGSIRAKTALTAEVAPVKDHPLVDPETAESSPPGGTPPRAEGKPSESNNTMVFVMIGVGLVFVLILLVVIIAVSRGKPKPPQRGYPPPGWQGPPPPGWQGPPPGGPPQQYARPQDESQWTGPPGPPQPPGT